AATGRLLRDLRVGLGPGELDAQAVVLLTQRVDLGLELLSLRDQGLQVRLRRDDLGGADAAGYGEGKRGRDGGQTGSSAQFAHSDARYWNRSSVANRLGGSFTFQDPYGSAWSLYVSGYRGRAMAYS